MGSGGAQPPAIVSRVVERDALDATALEMARTVAAMSPLAVRHWREILVDMSMPAVTKSIHDELLAQMLVFTSDDFAEFKRARAEGRPPEFRLT